MKKYEKHFKLDTKTARDYVKDFGLFPKNKDLISSEIGDGNINYIFKVSDKNDKTSIVLKQADILLRSSGRPLDIDRNRIEYEILSLTKELAPNFVPKIYHYNPTMCVIAMEDISSYKNLRKELSQNKIFPNFATEISSYLVDTLLPTTDLVMASDLKKDKVKSFINKELCDISECLVFREPYTDDKGRNIVIPQNQRFVEKYIYGDLSLRYEVAKLKNNFMNNAQALIHGDLHSGSIFINENGIKIIDPEFSFYGPMGYDIGNVIGNLVFALVNRKYLSVDEKFDSWLRNTIKDILNMFIDKFKTKYKELVFEPMYRSEKFMDYYLSEIISDSIGYAGTEIIRRVVGDSKVSEITNVEDSITRTKIERELLIIGVNFIKRREIIKNGDELFDLMNNLYYDKK